MTCRALVEPRDREQLARLLAIAHEGGIAVMPIGEGFNTIVTDDGLEGIAIKLSHFRELELRGGDALYAEAGVRHARVTRRCLDASVSGLEFAAGIPGSVGGWLSMNAGIGAREIKDSTLSVEWMSADCSEIKVT